MEITICKTLAYNDQKEIITIKENCILLEKPNGYPMELSNNKDIIDVLFTKFYSIMYTWKQEYIGPRTKDMEKYIITLDVNHKKKTFKIMNKYPLNWDEFLDLKNSVIDGGYL